MIIGHQEIINILNRSLERGTVAHAYLFAGPKSVGKFTLAEMFASQMISGGKNILETKMGGTNLDLIALKQEIEEKKDGAVKEKDIPIEAIRDAQSQLALFPQTGMKKVLIIDGAEFLTRGAQNALLKTLEEPNSTSVIILVAHDESMLLSTIKSRCQQVRFSLVGKEELKSASDNAENHDELISLSAGRPGILMKMLADEEFFSERKSMASTLEKAISGGLNERFYLAQEFSKNIPRAEEHLEFWLALLRGRAEKSGWRKTVGQMELIAAALENLKQTNANAKLALENLFINLA